MYSYKVVCHRCVAASSTLKLCFQVARIIGYIVLALPCKVEACGKRKSYSDIKPAEWNETEASTTKVTSLSSEEDRNILQKILQWLDEKDRAEEIKDQLFDIAAVLDRLAFIAMLAILSKEHGLKYVREVWVLGFQADTKYLVLPYHFRHLYCVYNVYIHVCTSMDSFQLPA